MPNNMSQTLGRPWKFNHEIEEFFVEDETRITLRKSDVTKRTETTELDDSLLHFLGSPSVATVEPTLCKHDLNWFPPLSF